MTEAGSLIVILEPAAEGQDAAARALAQEGSRLARELGVPAGVVEVPSLEPDLIGAVSRALGGLVAQAKPRALLLADNDGSRQLAVLLAHALGTGVALGCTAITVEAGRVVYREPVYGGWLEEALSFPPGSIEIATVDRGLLGAQVSGGGEESAPLVARLDPAGPPEAGYRRLEILPPDFRTVDLIHARRVVAAGIGGSRPELLPAVQELAELLEASVGVTRPVTDEGWVSKERLIGQTGRTVQPDLCLSLGASGSPHHLAGVQDAGTFLCVNRDLRAPVFQYSDAGYLGDLEEVLPALVDRIKKWRDDPGS